MSAELFMKDGWLWSRRPTSAAARRATPSCGCAPGQGAPTLAELRAHLEKSGMARQKWPEAFERVEDFPRTPAGKIKKFELRNRVREQSRG